MADFDLDAKEIKSFDFQSEWDIQKLGVK